MSTQHTRSADRPAGNICPWWLCPTFDNPLRRLIQDPDRILAGLVQPGETALDIGCGMGYFSIPLARLVGPEGKVICVDLQEQMLAGVRRRAERAGVADRDPAAPSGDGRPWEWMRRRTSPWRSGCCTRCPIRRRSWPKCSPV